MLSLPGPGGPGFVLRQSSEGHLWVAFLRNCAKVRATGPCALRGYDRAGMRLGVEELASHKLRQSQGCGALRLTRATTERACGWARLGARGRGARGLRFLSADAPGGGVGLRTLVR